MEPLHTELVIACSFLALLISWFSLWLMQRSRHWGDRRTFQLLALGAPTISLCVLAIVIGSMMVHGCQQLSWLDASLSFFLLAAGCLTLAIGFVSVSQRVWLARRLLGKVIAPLDNERVRQLLEPLAKGFGMRSPRLMCCETDYPLACMVGIWRPQIVLSSWVLENLDDGELEAVLAHEMAHLKHGDNLVGWMATWLKKGNFYLPLMTRAWAHIQQDREFASDGLAIQMTRKPMALASALLKVWQQGLSTSNPFPFAEAGAGFGEEGKASIEARIQHLLASSDALPRRAFSRLALMAVGMGGLLILCALLPLALMTGAHGQSCLLMSF